MRRFLIVKSVQSNLVKFQEAIKFLIVGLVNTSCNYLTFVIFLKYFEAQYLVAGIVGFSVGVLVAFFLNSKFTFQVPVDFKSKLKNYIAVQVICLGMHSCLQYLFVQYVGLLPVFSQLAPILFTTFINFQLIKIFVFKE